MLTFPADSAKKMSIHFYQQHKTSFLCSYNKDYSQKQTMCQLKHAPFFNAPNFNTLFLQFSPSTYPSTMNRGFKPLSYYKGYAPLQGRSFTDRTFSLNSSASVRKPLSLLQQVNSPYFKNLSTKGDLIFFWQF